MNVCTCMYIRYWLISNGVDRVGGGGSPAAKNTLYTRNRVSECTIVHSDRQTLSLSLVVCS